MVTAKIWARVGDVGGAHVVVCVGKGEGDAHVGVGVVKPFLLLICPTAPHHSLCQAGPLPSWRQWSWFWSSICQAGQLIPITILISIILLLLFFSIIIAVINIIPSSSSLSSTSSCWLHPASFSLLPSGGESQRAACLIYCLLLHALCIHYTVHTLCWICLPNILPATACTVYTLYCSYFILDMPASYTPCCCMQFVYYSYFILDMPD